MINYFNFKQFTPEHLLITNDFGAYSFISRKELQDLMHNSIEPSSVLYDELYENGFILPESAEEIVQSTLVRYRNAKNYLFGSTSLHIFVLTNECNLNCIYCQARDHERFSPMRMSIETAERAVDVALQSPEPMLNFEFQGGEPLLNFDTLKHIVEYSQAHKGHHEIIYSVVTNLTLLTDEMLEYFKAQGVRVSTSLDGHQDLHNTNRPFRNKQGSYDCVVQAIEKVRNFGVPIGAIQTTTRHSLKRAAEIINTYRNLGFDSIFIRPLTKLGTAIPHWDEIGYSAAEFNEFYKECLDHILQINKTVAPFSEGHAGIFLSKILRGKSQNYMELRSPCGAAIGQVAYYLNGDVYTCDEGRMLAEMGDTAFKLGNVYTHTYDQMMSSPVCKTVCVSSTLECLPDCAECVYQPYCGTCPVLNYASSHNVFKRDARGYRCQIYKGMLDTLFEVLYKNDPAEIDIIKNW